MSVDVQAPAASSSLSALVARGAERLRVGRIVSSDGLPLTYYRAGEAPVCLVIASAPAASVRFWLPLMGLLRGRFSVIAVEYRGFPPADRVLEPGEAEVPRIADDVAAVLAAEGVESAHLVTWCLGGKVAWELVRRHPRRVRSIAAIGFAYATGGEQATGPFSAALFNIRDHLEKSPHAAASMSRMMRLTRLVPDDAHLESLYREADRPLPDAAEAGDTDGVAAGGFHLIDEPVGLRNYLRLYESFRAHEIASLFPAMRAPVTVIAGTEDSITPLEATARAALDRIPGVRYETVDGASHYLPIEFPHRLADLLARHVERAERPAGGA